MTINSSVEIKLGPLDVLNKRELDFLPKHFVTTMINDRYNQKIIAWVRNKLSGRYCVCRTPQIDSDDKLKTVSVIGFENEKELTYFMLACPYIRRN